MSPPMLMPRGCGDNHGFLVRSSRQVRVSDAGPRVVAY